MLLENNQPKWKNSHTLSGFIDSQNSSWSVRKI